MDDGRRGSEIVVAGDVHLGAENADVDGFNDFLDSVYRRRPARFVLLGDVWDLVRRDPFGCAWETSETIARLKRLAGVTPVHLVYGNHDGHLRRLDDALYDVNFHEELTVESGGLDVRLIHGNEFDRLQSDALSTYLSGPGDRGDVDPTGGRKDPIVARSREVIQSGKRRFRTLLRADGGGESADVTTFPRRERRAHEYLDRIPADKLVYGHTHAPYVRHDNAVANAGSWKTTTPVHGTYLAIEGGEIELYRHRADGDDELIDPVGAP